MQYKSAPASNKCKQSRDTASSQKSPQPQIYHSPVHDLESFFWLLCWICLTREGPPTERRLDTESDKEDQAVALLNHQLFYEEDMEKTGTKKWEYFVNKRKFLEDVVDNFAPYFHSLQYLVIQLHDVLYKAYKSRKFDDLYEQFIAKLGECLKGLEQNATPPSEEEEDMIKDAEQRRSCYKYGMESEIKYAVTKNASPDVPLEQESPTPGPSKKRKVEVEGRIFGKASDGKDEFEDDL